jgi:UDP-N-acetylglucosamine 4-epimerase
VIPRWIDRLFAGQPCQINGDGETSRDFCFVENAIQANILAALAEDPAALDQVYNVACGERTTLKALYYMIRGLVGEAKGVRLDLEPEYVDFRPGDVRHSLADIGKARRLLHYDPTHTVTSGLEATLAWYGKGLGRRDSFLVTNGS